LVEESVRSRTVGRLRLDVRGKFFGTGAWPAIMRRNQWFQSWVLREWEKERPNHGGKILFSYSYAARELFAFARSRGWRCVLGQIDPGIVEERIVAKLYSRSDLKSHQWRKAPPEYWTSWQECELADVIVVNSQWSRDALIQIGLPPDKLVVVPLVYQVPPEATTFERSYPRTFSAERPLRLLFLGQLILRKGITEIREAMKRLRGEPVELWLAGPDGGDWPKENGPSNVKRFGVVSRSETNRFYRDADVFLFPSHSDGFGLTQLEARAWKLPIIASRNCGEVVACGVNGLLLDKADPTNIAAAIRRLLRAPSQLETLSAGSRADPKFSLDELARRLEAVAAPEPQKQIRQGAPALELNLSR